jgi:hypothetical protein
MALFAALAAELTALVTEFMVSMGWMHRAGFASKGSPGSGKERIGSCSLLDYEAEETSDECRMIWLSQLGDELDVG